MTIARTAGRMLLALAGLCATAVCWSQSYPARPIRVLHGVSAGGPEHEATAACAAPSPES